MNQNLTGWILAVLALIGSILGIGRYIGSIEQRITTIEKAQQYLHGDIRVPKE